MGLPVFALSLLKRLAVNFDMYVPYALVLYCSKIHPQGWGGKVDGISTCLSVCSITCRIAVILPKKFCIFVVL